jgi:hypothetical protein
MWRNKTKLPHAHPQTFKATLLLIILLSAISFVTSYKGLLILHTAGSGSTDIWQQAFTAFVVFTIQVMLVVTLLFMIHGYRWITRVLALFVYLVAMLFSVFFSYGWWYEVFRAGSYAQEVYQGSVETIRSSAKEYEQAFGNVEEGADALSKYSALKAREETLYGGTCAEASPPGRGALTYLRNQEASLFDGMVKDVSGLQQKVKSNVGELNRLLSDLKLKDSAAIQQRERDLNDMVSIMNQYKNGPVLAKMRTQLLEHRGDKRQFLESQNPKSGERTVVSCVDTDITGKIDALLLAFDGLPETRKVELFDQNNSSTVLERSWDVFSTIFTLRDLGLAKEKVAGLKLTRTDYMPLVAGFVIDLFILVLGFIDGLEYGRFYTGKQYSLHDAQNLEKFYAGQSAENSPLALLQPYLYRGWFSYYLIIPVAQSIQSDKEQRLHQVVAWLEAHKKLDNFAHAVGLPRLPAMMQAFFATQEERQVSQFDIYRMKKSMWRELVISHAYAKQPSAGEQP